MHRLRDRGRRTAKGWELPRTRESSGFLRHARIIIAVLVLTLSFSLAVIGGHQAAYAGQSADWPAFMLGPDHTSYNVNATSITQSNLADLQPVWRWTVPASTNGGATGIYTTPVSVGGVFYVGADDGDFYAVNESTGQIIWSKFLGLVQPGECSPAPLGFVSTAAVAADSQAPSGTAVYVNAPDGYLYALDSASGSVLWKQVVAIPSSTQNNYVAWSSPLVAPNGNVYVGISSNCDNPLVPAGVLGFNAETGSALGEWHSMPAGQVGASVWSSQAALPDGSGQIIATTGNGTGTGSAPLYADAIVRLDGSNMNMLDYWQVPASQQITDGDFGGSPTVFTADLNGTSTEMVGACNKNGIYYALKADNLSAGAVWEKRINAPYTSGGQCDSGAIWDGARLIEGAGNQTTINGTTYQGGVYALDPATGNPLWETGLPGEVIGSPTEDGAGVVAAPIWSTTTNNYGIYLLSAQNGAILDYIPLGRDRIFGQPVFEGNSLLIGGLNPFVGITAYQVTVPNAPITAVTPHRLGRGATETITLVGSGFSGTPKVFVSSTLVQVDSVQVTSPTTLSVQITAASTADTGWRDIAVIQPGSSGPIADTCAKCLQINWQPTVSSASPSAIPAGETATVTLTDRYIQSNATVTSASGIVFSPAKLLSATQASTQATVAPSVAPGSYNLTVTNPDGGTGQCTGCLTVTSDPQPALTAVSPSAVGQQSKITLKLTGTGFTTDSAVSFSASGVKVDSQKYVSSTALEVTISVTGKALIGPGDVTATTPGGSGTCSGCLTIDPHAQVRSLSPNSVQNGTTATITVAGANFVSGFAVTTTIPGAVVGTPANVTSSSFTVAVTVPAGTTAGSYLLKVVNPDGGTGSGVLSVT